MSFRFDHPSYDPDPAVKAGDHEAHSDRMAQSSRADRMRRLVARKRSLAGQPSLQPGEARELESVRDEIDRLSGVGS